MKPQCHRSPQRVHLQDFHLQDLHLAWEPQALGLLVWKTMSCPWKPSSSSWGLKILKFFSVFWIRRHSDDEHQQVVQQFDHQQETQLGPIEGKHMQNMAV